MLKKLRDHSILEEKEVSKRMWQLPFFINLSYITIRALIHLFYLPNKKILVIIFYCSEDIQFALLNSYNSFGCEDQLVMLWMFRFA